MLFARTTAFEAWFQLSRQADDRAFKFDNAIDAVKVASLLSNRMFRKSSLNVTGSSLGSPLKTGVMPATRLTGVGHQVLHLPYSRGGA